MDSVLAVYLSDIYQRILETEASVIAVMEDIQLVYMAILSLHPTTPSIESSVSMKSNTNKRTRQISSMIIPVYLSGDKNPKDEHMVYAMLDSQSDTTFMLEEVASKLQADSAPAKQKISFMASLSVIHCRRYTSLKVRGLE